MSFRPSLGSACAVGALLIGLTCRGAAAAETFVFHHEDVMGTSMELRLVADSEALARRAEDRALREIDRLSAIFSSYDPGSEFSRWMAGPRTPVRIAPELFEVLRARRPLADGQRGRVRAEDRGADAALVAVRQGGPHADPRGDRRRPGPR